MTIETVNSPSGGDGEKRYNFIILFIEGHKCFFALGPRKGELAGKISWRGGADTMEVGVWPTWVELASCLLLCGLRKFHFTFLSP